MLARIDVKRQARDKASTSYEDGTVKTLGQIYLTIYNFSIIARVGSVNWGTYRYPYYPRSHSGERGHNWWCPSVFAFAWFEVAWGSLWVCKIFVKFIPCIFQTLCSIISSGTRKYALILLGLDTPVTLVLWNRVYVFSFSPCNEPENGILVFPALGLRQ